MKCWGPGREEFFTWDVTFEILDHRGYTESLQVDKGIPDKVWVTDFNLS